MGLPDGEEIMTLALFVLTILARDGRADRQMDRQTDTLRSLLRYPRLHSVARVKIEYAYDTFRSVR